MTTFNQFTFWNANDTSEHVTLRFVSDGTIEHLSRDETRSVRETWNVVGTHKTIEPNSKRYLRLTDETRRRFVLFTSAVPHLWVAATHLSRSCFIHGAQVRLTSTDSRRTEDETNPDTFLLRPGRRRSVNAPGETYAGERGASRFRVNGRGGCDASAMRAAIQRARLNRK